MKWDDPESYKAVYLNSALVFWATGQKYWNSSGARLRYTFLFWTSGIYREIPVDMMIKIKLLFARYMRTVSLCSRRFPGPALCLSSQTACCLIKNSRFQEMINWKGEKSEGMPAHSMGAHYKKLIRWNEDARWMSFTVWQVNLDDAECVEQPEAHISISIYLSVRPSVRTSVHPNIKIRLHVSYNLQTLRLYNQYKARLCQTDIKAGLEFSSFLCFSSHKHFGRMSVVFLQGEVGHDSKGQKGFAFLCTNEKVPWYYHVFWTYHGNPIGF